MDKGLIWGALALSGIAVLAIMFVSVRHLRLTREETIVWKTRVHWKARLSGYLHWKLCLIYIGEGLFLFSLVEYVFKPHILPALMHSGFTLLEAKILFGCAWFQIFLMMSLLGLAVGVPIIRRILARVPTEDQRIEKGPSL